MPDPSAPYFWMGVGPGGAEPVEGQSLALEAGAQSYPAPTQQWQHSTDSIAWADIAGATGNKLAITNFQARDAGYYRMVASNSFGIGLSFPTKVRYIPAPAHPFANLLLTASGFQFQQLELLGRTYVIYASSDLTLPWSNWVALTTNVAGTNLIIDPDAGRFSQRFYRSKLVPEWWGQPP